MTEMTRQQRQEEHEAHIARMKESGHRFNRFECPHCGETDEALRPDPGDCHDSMRRCPYCDGLYFWRSFPAGSVEILWA